MTAFFFRIPGLGKLAGGLVLALGAACVSGGTGAGEAPAGNSDDRAEITILGTTDVHGRIVPWDYYTATEEDLGLARVATLVDSIRAANPSVILVDSGDLLQGNPFDYYYGVVEPEETHPVIAAMNHLGYDAAAVGNHEFNFGIPALERAIAGAEFPFLGANVFVAGTDSTAFPPFRVVERAGVRVGILGLTTPGSTIWDRANVEGKLEFRDIVESARRFWPELARASDVQIAVMHSGLGPGSSYDEAATGVPPEDAGGALAEALPGLEAIFLGHSHRVIPADTVAGVLVTQAGRWAEALAVVSLSLERTDGAWRVVDRSATARPTAGVPPDPALMAEMRPFHERVVAYVADTIGFTPDAWSAAAARVADTAILDLIQRVQLDATGADLSAASAFNPEATLGPGPITQADAASLYAYDNTLKTIRVTGRQLREYLEYSAKYFHRTTPEGALIDAGGDADLEVDSVPGYNFDVVAGVEYSIDVTNPLGERIVDLTYRGEPVADDRTFTLAINNYRQGGGGGYSMIADAPVVSESAGEVRQLLIDWIAGRDTIHRADVYERSWRIVPEAAVAGYVAADSERLTELLEREAARIQGEAPAQNIGREAPAQGVAESGRDAPPGLLSLPPPLPAGSDSVRIAFIGTNDFHGALEPTTPVWADGDTIGGAATMAAYVRPVEARYPGATIHLDGGDQMQGTVISNLSGGRASIDVMNALGVDAAAIGNHEFDWSIDTLEVRMAQAEYPFLSANIFVKGTGERPEWAVPYAWLERAGLRIAVIGATTTSTPYTTMPANVEPYEFRDIAQTVNALVPGLKAEGADLVVLVVHAGGIEEGHGGVRGEIADAARRITEPLDLIVSGHTHTRLQTVVNGIPIVQAASSGAAVAVAVLTYDRAARRTVGHSLELWTTRMADVVPDSAMASRVERWRAMTAELANRPITELAQTLIRDRRGESALGDLIADAQRAATGTEMAMTNAGGIRADLQAGPLSFRDVFAVQPFQNTLVRMTLTGEQVRQVLEAAVTGSVGQVSGVRFSFDPTRPVGDRVLDAWLEDTGEQIVEGGRAVSPDRIHTMTVNTFMASGGDDYGAFEDALQATNTGLIDSDVFADYLESLPRPIRYGIQNRIQLLAPWPPPDEAEGE
ncbi:MAG TPA: 5'-nucleotidase C-terminal domain-containing protein [Gemmatimonadota bacterium]|nr:5'-nucleotidase C-terminal domain-containing protein [Gemmatimonadota bacterium]